MPPYSVFAKLTSIIGVLHDGHELDDIVAQVFDTWQGIPRELLVRTNPQFGSRDADVCLVDASTSGLGRAFVLELVTI